MKDGMARAAGDAGTAFARQAALCRRFDAPFTARVIEAAWAAIDPGSALGRQLTGWGADHWQGITPLRLAGGLHALARGGAVPALSACYAALDGPVEAAVAEAIASHGDWLGDWLLSAPQTNEVGRSAVLMAGLLALGAERVELLELGASAGLNLMLDRYAHRLGGRSIGAGALLLAPEWRGADPVGDLPLVVARRGVDLAPLALDDAAAIERLIAFVWADQRTRIARLEQAVALARADPPPVDAADAADWLEARLAEPQPAGVTRVVLHSIAVQYFGDAARARIAAAMDAAGARADESHPLAWLAMELAGDGGHAALTLRRWPDGAERHLADAHPHGTWVDWAG